MGRPESCDRPGRERALLRGPDADHRRPCQRDLHAGARRLRDHRLRPCSARPWRRPSFQAAPWYWPASRSCTFAG